MTRIGSWSASCSRQDPRTGTGHPSKECSPTRSRLNIPADRNKADRNKAGRNKAGRNKADNGEATRSNKRGSHRGCW